MRSSGSLRPHIRVALLIGVVAAGISAAIPLGYDEGYWLGISRMLASGRVLYETAIDNKSPVVYAVVGVLDLLPGQWLLWRAVTIGMLTGAMSLLLAREGTRTGDSATMVPWLAPLATCLLAGFQLQTELLAAPLLIGGLALATRGETFGAVLTAIISTTITPLAVMTIPVVLWVARARADRRGWAVATVASVILATAIALFVLAHPTLRYGLVELNLASRATLGAGEPLTVPARTAMVAAALLPAAAIGLLRGMLRRDLAVTSLIALPSVAALLAFPHYWILATSAIAFFAANRSASEAPTKVALAVLALVPLTLLTAVSSVDSWRSAQRYDRIAERLRQLPSADWTFATFDLQPHLTVYFPDRMALLSPSVNYLAWETSRTSVHRAETTQLLDEVDVLVDPGLSQNAEPASSLQPLVPLFLPHLDSFACSKSVAGVEIHLREDLCGP